VTETVKVWQRLCCSWWRALMTLDFSGRRDWQLLINQSDLPDDIKATLRQLISTIRLTRSERVSVASELVAHFKDGHEYGESWPSLLADFGDAATVANLIQRSKERNRSMLSNVWKAGGLLFGVGGLTLIVWFFLFSHRQAMPNVNYTRVLNSRALASAEADRGWPVYRPAWTRHEFVNINMDAEFQDIEGGFVSLGPDHAEWPRVTRMLDDRHDLLEALRAGARRPAFGLKLQGNIQDYDVEDRLALYPKWVEPSGNNPPTVPRTEADRIQDSMVVAILLPHVQAFRTGAYLMLADARRAIHDQDYDRAIQDIETNFGMARHAAEPSCFVAWLVAFRVSQLGYRATQELLESSDQLTPAQRDRLAQAVRHHQLAGLVAGDMETIVIQDLIQRLYTDDGQGHGKITKPGLAAMGGLLRSHDEGPDWRRIAQLIRSDRKDIMAPFEKFNADFQSDLGKTWQQQPRTMEQLVQTHFRPDSVSFLLAEALVPNLDTMRDSLQQHTSQRQAVLTAIALHQFRLDTGHYPDGDNKLQPLVPDYLTDIPKDPVTGQDLTCQIDDGNIQLYYWGDDGDDDGGQPLVDEMGRQSTDRFGMNAKELAGDWLLWPIID